VHVFIHGGYWQEFSKRESNFAAGNFLNHNCILVVMDYTLAPQAKLAQIIAEIRAGLLWVLQNIVRFGGDQKNITASGHSAGAHLLAECIAMDWKSEGYSACPLKGALLVSGVYDLRPLVDTYINDALGMDDAQASAASPLLHLPKSACPMVFTVGEYETDAFKQQTADYCAALHAKGIDSTFIPMTGFNHFDIILELGNAKSPLFGAIKQQAGGFA
jgi:arylformamidase